LLSCSAVIGYHNGGSFLCMRNAGGFSFAEVSDQLLEMLVLFSA